MAARSPLATHSTGGGLATAGGLAGRAVLAVPLDAELWELDVKRWDVSDEDECEDSYWPPDERTTTKWSEWGVRWVQPEDLIAFIEMHWPEFDAESIAASRL